MDHLTPADVAPAEPTEGEVARVVALAERLRDEEREVIAATAALKAKLDAYNRTAEVDIPDAMRAAGISEWPLRLLDGKPLRLVERLQGGQLTDPEGLEYVVAQGGEALIKTRILIEAGMGDHDEARALYEELRRRVSNRWNIQFDRHVHASTTGAFARELEHQGRAPDLEKLHVRRTTRAQLGDRRPRQVELKGLVER